jgi:glucose/arabinose dehydrogenase
MNRRVLQAMAAGSLLMGCQSQGTAQGQQRSPQPFTVGEVAEFSTPWAMAFLPGSGVPLTNMALLTEKEGRLWLVDVASGKRTPVSGAPKVVVAGQGGLGDVVPHPDFAGNQRVYLSFVEAGPNGTSGAAVGYGRLLFAGAAVPGGPVNATIDGFKVIWRQQPKVNGDVHFSHRIAFAPDGTLFVSSGERFKFTPAQDPNSDLGKIIHMTDEGQRIGGRFYTLGHRNVLGLSIAPDGRLWASEMGPMGGDEVNLILPGMNYGWPKVSNGSHYDGRDIPDHKAGDGFEAPKIWWNPSISPGSLMIYTGDKFPQWKGDALVGALSGEALIRIDIEGDTARKAEEWPMGARIRAVDQGPDGSVYLLEDGPSGGRLLRLNPK